MGSKKRARTLPQPEECGVWLDASQLKKKCHQTVIPCTSSRFNPLSRRQSISSVLIEFTQTKSPQLCTKQTSMYSFFSPAGNREKQPCVAAINTLSEETSPECEGIKAQETPNVMTPSRIEASMCWKPTYSDSEHAENKKSVFLHEKHRKTEKPVSSGQNENDAWSCVLDKNENPVSSSILRSQDKSLNPPSNYRATAYDSKYRNNLSDASVSECPQEDYNKEHCFPPSQFESQLFTQDTQGNRVICHRFTSERRMNAAPLQDKTNAYWDTRSPMKGTLQTLHDEDTLHKMFTQDSEGNMVIKH
ncbi:aurora kinase A and ninein-interacting protein isoform X1 [Hyla sarda]|uniref:aurora kinase A and ninein-interacting protein isoform X1 n=1 Tax=Hyla sarda TaxID=327740 RepID=UPI0024C3BC32|nr:aurora kinase A and ninein-interacting protein isoform X1 [Hyla sarda]